MAAVHAIPAWHRAAAALITPEQAAARRHRSVSRSVSAASDVRSDLVQLVLLSKRNSNSELASTTGLNNL